MCTYNQETRIERAIRGILSVRYPCEVELVVVDDGSTDGTALAAERIEDARLSVHRHEFNRGQGAALRTGARLAAGTHLLPFDADPEYSPEDIPSLINPVVTRGHDIVYGVRLFGFNTVYQSYVDAMGNRLFTRLANILFSSNVSDLHTCPKLVPVALFRELDLREPGSGLDTELTAVLLRLGYKPFEVPVSYCSRSQAKGKRVSWRDAAGCVMILFKVRVRPKKRLLRRPGAAAALPAEIAEPARKARRRLLTVGRVLRAKPFRADRLAPFAPVTCEHLRQRRR